MGRQFAVLIRGLPGTGKTTTTALLRDALPPSVRVSNDSVRYMAHPRDFTAFTLEASELACLDLALSYCDSGFLPVVDGVFEDVDFLAGQAVRFDRRGHRLVTVSLAADLEDLLHRNRLRDPFQRMDEDRVRRLHAAFRPAGVSLDIRGKLPEEVCDDVLDVIGRDRTDGPPTGVGDHEVDVLFLRHGERGRPHGADPVEVGLSARGRAEAGAAAAAVRRFAPDVVLSSDSAPDRETVRLATAGLDVTAERAEALRDRVPPGAPDESPEAVRDRVWSFFDELPARHGGKRVLVVGHAGPHSWLVARALGVDRPGVGRLRWDTGCFSRFTLSAGQTRLETMNVPPDAVVPGR
ncbi:histidine phosphatase family protein [Saccharothrix sp. 6-C]|uniref:histidine phosphatase family protein n=1 Tax=Saccharothrix sp. 6-C TaxID=2781735 RepID=UPI0019179848|nr:histidine phosphatase family protein [Saccharothrix sp. 6-C]QQQ79205.1 histidine phosphatase family protein [Saccharothrix sp. 6-C]